MGALEHCPGCQGIWLEQAAFYGLCLDTGSQERWTPILARASAPATTPKDLVAYRPCPVCRSLMNRLNFGGTSHIIVDMCREHGTWFDAGELSRVFAFLRGGGLQAAGVNPAQYLAAHVKPASNLRLAQAFAMPIPGQFLGAEPEPTPHDLLLGVLGALLKP